MLAVVQKLPGKGYCIDIYDADRDEEGNYTDEPLRTLKVPDDAVVNKVCWGRNNAYVLSVDDQGRLLKWSIDDEAVMESIKLSKRPLTDMSISKDRMMVLVSAKDMIARMVELDHRVEDGSDDTKMKVLKTYESDRPLNTCAIHPTMNHVLVAGGQDANDVTLSGAAEGHFEVDFWHVYYEEHLASVHGHFGPVNTVAVSPNGLYFASGSEDGYVRLYQFDDTYLNGSY
jgi:translation initiation factor 3 subunit I